MARQADVADKVVTWMLHDNQLPGGITQATALQLQELLQRLRHQLKVNLAPLPRRALPEVLSPEELSRSVQQLHAEVVTAIAEHAKRPAGSWMSESTAKMIMRCALAFMFWGFVQPLRSSGK